MFEFFCCYLQPYNFSVYKKKDEGRGFISHEGVILPSIKYFCVLFAWPPPNLLIAWPVLHYRIIYPG